jgi:serine/threonine protein kinase
MAFLPIDTLLIGRYLIRDLLGQGGMGAVYLARDENLNKKVAVKQTFFREDYLRRAFKREAQLLASLNHPALPRVSDHFVEGEDQFLVMDYIEGCDLAKLLEQRGAPFEPAEMLAWAYQLLDVLEYLHTQEIIHRDIKPQNLKLNTRGKIILLDFGLAKGTPSDVTGLTTGISLYGYSINYAALEQIQGLVTDPTSDLFSLAATLYHLMTGKVAPNAMTRAASLSVGDPDPLRPANELHPQVPIAIASVLMQAMSFNRQNRPATAAAMRKALEDAARSSSIQTESRTPARDIPQEPAPVPLGRAPQDHSQTQAFGSDADADPQAPSPEMTISSAPAESLGGGDEQVTELSDASPQTSHEMTGGAESLKEVAPARVAPTSVDLSLIFECPIECHSAWPLSGGSILVWEKAGGALAVWEAAEVVWRDREPLRIRRESRAHADRLAFAGWCGEVRCFAEGEIKVAAKLPGTVGDVQYCAGRWVAGTWKHSLVSIDSAGDISNLLEVEMGVFRISAMKEGDRFAVADLSGRIAIYRDGKRVITTPTVGTVSSMAFAGRRLVVLSGDSLITVEPDGKVGPREPRPGSGKSKLISADWPDRCLLLNDNGACWSINESGVHMPYVNFAEGQTLLSHCEIPRRFTVSLREGGCAYWRDGHQTVWTDAIRANLSSGGKLVAVIFSDKVRLYEDKNGPGPKH